MAMFRKKCIGIIGNGFVGSAIAAGFDEVADVRIYDTQKEKTRDTLGDTVNESDFIFICVPTPTLEGGNQHQLYLDVAVTSVIDVAENSKIIVIKSTVVPGTTRAFAIKFPDHTFLFNPEFLIERDALRSFMETDRIIVGGEPGAPMQLIYDLYQLLFEDEDVPYFRTTWEGAELLKYMANNFLAVKLAYLNEIYDVAEALGVPYTDLRYMFMADSRIGCSHTSVPGPDNYRGFGGTCLPKDLKAFIGWAEQRCLTTDMCKAAEIVNARVRKEG